MIIVIRLYTHYITQHIVCVCACVYTFAVRHGEEEAKDKEGIVVLLLTV